MKEIVAKLLKKEIKLDEEVLISLIEVPPKLELGDYAFPCFSLAKEMKKSPLAIAESLVEKFRKDGLPKEITNISMNAGYVNFYIDKKTLAEDVLKNVLKKDFGKNNFGKKEKICLDMSSPNIAKPFGIGHLRSTIIGNSVANIAKANGFEVMKINYFGDWGTQFGKIINAYKKHGDEKKLKEDPIKYLYELYVEGNKTEYEEESRKEFKKLEEGDNENLKLWNKFRKLSLAEFDSIYEILGITFDKISGESEYNGKMGPAIKELDKKGLTKIDDGANIIDLKKEKLGVALIQKSDGTSLYHTRDIVAAIDRIKNMGCDKLFYEVGQEQKLYFRQLFKILEMMGYNWAKECRHISHGLYLDKDGKKFATRKGKTLFMKDVLLETISKAKDNLKEKTHGLSETELNRRARIIAIAAIFYGDLKVNLKNDVIFDIDKFLSFEGDTGPYLLYTYARANSIIKKVKSKKPIKIIDLKDPEIELIKKIDSYPKIVEKAYETLSPNIIANYAFELAQNFNEFYHNCPVLGSIEEGFRLKLVEATRIVLGKALDLLGIETLEEM